VVVLVFPYLLNPEDRDGVIALCAFFFLILDVGTICTIYMVLVFRVFITKRNLKKQTFAL
jgi:hypothetical protein